MIATLGDSYLRSIFTGGGISNTSLKLTVDRLAGVGTAYTAATKRIVSFSGDLRSLSSIGLEYYSNFMLLIFGILLLAAYGIGVLLIVWHFWAKRRLVVIDFGGEPYRLSVRGHTNEEVEEFVAKVLSYVRTLRSGA